MILGLFEITLNQMTFGYTIPTGGHLSLTDAFEKLPKDKYEFKSWQKIWLKNTKAYVFINKIIGSSAQLVISVETDRPIRITSQEMEDMKRIIDDFVEMGYDRNKFYFLIE